MIAEAITLFLKGIGLRARRARRNRPPLNRISSALGSSGVNTRLIEKGLEGIKGRISHWRHRLGPDVWKRFAVVLLSVAGSSGVAFALRTLLPGQAHLLPFTLAVIASSWYGGLIPGLAATILSVGVADYFFIEPLFHIEADSALLAVFLVVGVSISFLQKALAKTNAALRESNRRIELASKE